MNAEPTPSRVDSPCVGTCCLDPLDVCVGCGRTIDEILSWGQAAGTEREAIVAQAAARKARR